MTGSEELEKIAERKGIKLPYDPITDEAETGTNFDRDGIQEVFEKTKRKDIDYLLVEKVDRVGRTAAETLYFIYILQSECGVTLLTSSGSKDVSEAPGLMQTTVMSLTAQIQNELRIAKANKERIRGFLKKKNWKCKSSKIPLGYKETDDGWLTTNPEEKPIVRDLFQKFETCGNYSETERYIDNKYGKEYLNGHKVKTVLQNRVYIGQPRLPESWLEDTTYENDLHEPELNLLKDEDDAQVDICEATFHQVQKIIQEKEQQCSDDDTMELLDFVEEFSLFSVIQGSNPATLLHHCGNPLIKDGQVDLRGEYTVHRYKCRHCEETEDASDYYRRWPKDYELDAIRLIQQVVDGDVPDFIDTG
jgi:DNA invertase Pin-like site-specific DNA recombinase